MKKTRPLSLLLALILSLFAGCGQILGSTSTASSNPPVGSPAPASSVQSQLDKIDVKIATVLAESSLGHEALLKFVEEVENRLPGRINFMIYPNSQLGGERDFGNALLLGTVQGAIIADTSMGMIAEISACRLGEIPYLCDDWETYYAMMDRFYIDEILDKAYQDNGFYGLSYFFFTNADIANSKKEVRSLTTSKA